MFRSIGWGPDGLWLSVFREVPGFLQHVAASYRHAGEQNPLHPHGPAKHTQKHRFLSFSGHYCIYDFWMRTGWVFYLDEIVGPSYHLCLVGFSSENVEGFLGFCFCVRLHLWFWNKQDLSKQDSCDLWLIHIADTDRNWSCFNNTTMILFYFFLIVTHKHSII